MIEKIPFYEPEIGEEEKKEIVKTLDSGWITTGPKTEKFEEKLKDYLDVENVIAVNSCTAGLHLSLAASNISKDDEVITTPFTFISTINAILYRGAKPVMVDIDEETMNIDPEKIKEKINRKTKAIMPVDYAGHPCKLDEINKIAKENNILVIEDAAHAIGSEYKGEKVGKQSKLTNFSFYATKNLTTGEGGAIATEDKELAEKLKLLRLHGMSKDAWKRYSDVGSWYYEVAELGYKYNMTDLQASLGIHQLNKLEGFTEKRREIAEQYSKAFSTLDEIKTPVEKSYVKHAWHLYPIRLELEKIKINRNKFIKKLKKKGMGASVHFIPVHMHPYHQKKLNCAKGDYPLAEKAYERIISLPLFTKMTESQVQRVIKEVKDILKNNKKG